MPNAANDRLFSVYARHVDSHHARVVSEPSFEAAAVAYLEDLHAAPGGGEIRVIVRDIHTGHEHCYRIDMETGDASPCG